MPDFLLLMHSDALQSINDADWGPYFARLGARFEGGSAIGAGECVRKSGVVPGMSKHLTGYIRVQAESLDAAKVLLSGNPVFEAGGTVEIRALPRG
ncbi:MAG TPA: hypothetical protein VGG48_00545 [Rhizomicrobium sp.]|jgi:hypothetical protein